jgi:hypothetical protein
MAGTVAEMTRDELSALIEEAVERKLMEILRDPDEGLEVSEQVLARLQRQRAAVADGERGQSLDEVVSELGLQEPSRP